MVRVDHRLSHLTCRDALFDFLGQRDGVDAEFLDLDAALLEPLIRQLFVQEARELLGVSRNGGVTNAKLGDACEGGLQCGEQLALHLRLEAVACIRLFDVAANLLVEDQRIDEAERVFAVHADCRVHVETEVGVDDAERNGRAGAVLVADDFLRVEEVDALVFARVATEGETLADALERGPDALAQVAVEDGRLGRAVIHELAGLGANVDDLAGLDDDHALAVVDGDDRAIGNDVALASDVRAAPLVRSALLTLHCEDVLVESVAIEEIAPGVGQHAASCACNRVNQTHSCSLHCAFCRIWRCDGRFLFMNWEHHTPSS